uniref:SGNH hydrolase-type esterase domain-containing protein n=1 Tax=Mastacembelus armatus TaxID=205130 RepID=A0A7N8YAA9_9TELE
MPATPTLVRVLLAEPGALAENSLHPTQLLHLCAVGFFVRQCSGTLMGSLATEQPTCRLHLQPQHHMSPPRLPHQPARRHGSNGLFPRTTSIIGDSIIRKICFFNATTHCFPGATASDILDMLTANTSIIRVIVHIGTCDTSFYRSELTKKYFISLFNLLSNCGKSILISGPIPTLGRGSGLFSRILSLNTWLKSVSLSYSLQFINNFNLFWNWPAFFAGLHPNHLDSHMLSTNIQHAVHCTLHANTGHAVHFVPHD